MKFLAHTGVSILLVLFLAYLPFSAFVFALKNDAFTAYFPVKYFMSESLHAGYFPWWNPFLNYGIPQYADMSSAFWNPITFLFASTIGYNVYSFTIEELLYIFLAGLFMYRLCSYWELKREVKFIAAISYACCGFVVGHLQHFNWISGAAWLPLAFHAYLLAWLKPTVKRAVLASLAFYMFASSAHPALLIGAFYFFGIVLVVRIYDFIRNKKQDLRKVVVSHLVISAAFLLMALAMLMSWSEILPHMDRGSSIGLAASQVGPTPLGNWISFVLAFRITQSSAWLNNDIALRNVYMGLSLFLMLVFAVLSRKSKWQNLLLITGLAFFLLSSGGIFKQVAYYTLPFLSYVRLDGEFRIFGLFSWTLASAIALNNFVRNGWNTEGTLKIIYRSLTLLLILGIVIGLVQMIQTEDGILMQFPARNSQVGWGDYFKQIIDTLKFHDTLILQGLFQLLILFLGWRALKNKSLPALAKAAAFDLIVATLLNMPFTGVGKTSLHTVSAMVASAQKGFPIPDLKPVNEHPTSSPAEEKIIGSWGFYNKEIGSREFMPYPVLLNSTRSFFESPAKTNADQQPFAYLENAEPGDSISVQNFHPGLLAFEVQNINGKKLILKQNAYPGWNCTIDRRPVKTEPAQQTFISVAVPPGRHTVEFAFQKENIKAFAWISLFSILAALCVAGYSFYLDRSNES